MAGVAGGGLYPKITLPIVQDSLENMPINVKVPFVWLAYYLAFHVHFKKHKDRLWVMKEAIVIVHQTPIDKWKIISGDKQGIGWPRPDAVRVTRLIFN